MLYWAQISVCKYFLFMDLKKGLPYRGWWRVEGCNNLLMEEWSKAGAYNFIFKNMYYSSFCFVSRLLLILLTTTGINAWVARMNYSVKHKTCKVYADLKREILQEKKGASMFKLVSPYFTSLFFLQWKTELNNCQLTAKRRFFKQNLTVMLMT